jgi:hypothetical protein
MSALSATSTGVLPVPRALLIVGLVSFLVGSVTMAASLLVYADSHPFSVFTVYYSEVGATPVWPQVIVTTGGLLSAPLRYAFVVLLVLYFRSIGGGRIAAWAILLLATVSVTGLIGLLAVPFTLNRDVHLVFAQTHFFAVVAVQTAIWIEERRLRLSALLTTATLAVIVTDLVFAVLLTLVGKVDFVTRTTPVIWEWLAFAAQFYWGLIHSFLIGVPALRRWAPARA